MKSRESGNPSDASARPPSSSSIVAVKGRGVPVRGDDIDTDRIVPARYLKCVTFEGLGDHAFEDDRKSSAGGSHPFDRKEFQGARILAVNRNFGCGSSREHAPQSLLRWGIRGVVGESFAEIFFGNCVVLGLPCMTLPGEEIARLQDAVEKEPGLEILLDVEGRTVSYAGRSVAARLPDGAWKAYVTGTWDSTRLLMERPGEVDRVAAALPYVSAWKRPS